MAARRWRYSKSLRVAQASVPAPCVALTSTCRATFLTLSESLNEAGAGQADPERPVAVLFGWLGAKDRGLAKYAQLYHALGCDTVLRGTAPGFETFFKPKALRSYAETTLRTIQEQYPGRPVVLCYFSNGGLFVHEQLMGVWRDDTARAPADRRFGNVHISALVCDSCPAYLSASAGANAVSGGITNPVLRRLVSGVGFVALGLFLPLIWGFGRPGKYFAALAADPIPAPALYIHSKTDKVTDSEQLARFVQMRQAAPQSGGLPIREWIIDDRPSPHVTHYLIQPQEYARRVARFLRDDAKVTGIVDPEAAASAVQPSSSKSARPQTQARSGSSGP